MRPHEFEHILAAAARVTGQDEFVVIGGQAILGSSSEPPEGLLESMEADIYPLNDPAAADLIDGALGDGSPFQAAFGYYAHGVGPETAKAPAGWQKRLVRREIPPRLKEWLSRLPTRCCRLEAGLVFRLEISERPGRSERS